MSETRDPGSSPRGDRIYIEGLEVDTVIGVFDWEREIEQTVSIDLELDIDLSRAAATDRLDDALDYKAQAKAIVQLVRESRAYLIESLAERVASHCLEDRRVHRVRVRLSKPGALRDARNVGVEIIRARE